MRLLIHSVSSILSCCIPLLIAVTVFSQAPSHCASVQDAASRAKAIQRQLLQVRSEGWETTVPVAAKDTLTQLKDALSDVADAVMACASPDVSAQQIQNRLEKLLDANQPGPPEHVITESDIAHMNDAIPGTYGYDLRAQVAGAPGGPALLTIDFSIGVVCGDDHLLLLYTQQNGAWKQIIRWQAKPYDEVSGAFGDFFVSGILARNKDSEPRLIVAHGTPWCTSRHSAFNIDLLSPQSDARTPLVLWHTKREYSRSDFYPRLKVFDSGFELRVNNDCMSVAENCFEYRVIYRYKVDENGSVYRVNPIATNARGFVEQWLSAPWDEAAGFLVAGADQNLKHIHGRFNRADPHASEFIGHSLGPVRACKAPGDFQIQIDSRRENTSPDKPDSPLPSYYFRVHEVKDGYRMVSVSTKPDPTCRGKNLMPAQQ